MIQYYNGSIFDSKADILCHQVNCQGAFGYGIAGQVKKLFPEVEKTYKRITKQWIEKENGDTSKLLGRVSAQPVEKDGRWFLIGNLYGQDDYGRKSRSIPIMTHWKEPWERSGAFWKPETKTRRWRFHIR